MSDTPSTILPRIIPRGPHKAPGTIRVAPQLLEAAACEPDDIFQKRRVWLLSDEHERRSGFELVSRACIILVDDVR